MKTIIGIFSLWALSGLAASAAPVEIQMKSLSFEPKRLEVKVGQAVVWKNVAHSEHEATSGETKPVIDTGLIEPGKESKPVVFEKAGEYEYHCAIHGKAMTGVVVVKAATK